MSNCSLPLAADRAQKPPTSSSLADQKRVGSLLLSTPAHDPLSNCSLPLAADRAQKPPTSSSLADQKRVGSLLLSTPAHDPLSNCSLPLAADRAQKAANLVVPRRPKTSRLPPPQHAGARSAVKLLAPARCGSRPKGRQPRRPSPTKNESAPSSSARRRTIRCQIARSRSLRIAPKKPPFDCSLRSLRPASCTTPQGPPKRALWLDHCWISSTLVPQKSV